ncbi:GAF domain-containing protein, partial [Nostoc sp. NIES-2111]
MPALFRRLVAGQAIDAPDAARDPTTAELHRSWMHVFGSRSLFSVPVMAGDATVGAVWLEDVPNEAPAAADFARAVANMVALRLTGRAVTPPRGGEAEAAPAPEPARGGTGDGTLLALAPEDLAAEVLPGVAVMALRFTDPVALARAAAPEIPIADTIASMLQEVAAPHGPPDAPFAGAEVSAAAGLLREGAGPG